MFESALYYPTIDIHNEAWLKSAALFWDRLETIVPESEENPYRRRSTRYPQFFKSKMRKEKFFLLLRQYEEEMLDAFLQDDDYFSELLHYCNILYEILPTILGASHLKMEKDARKLAAISMVAAGYAGDMPEGLCNELLDDIDYHFNKVKCRKIELMMPKLMKMVESEMEGMR